MAYCVYVQLGSQAFSRYRYGRYASLKEANQAANRAKLAHPFANYIEVEKER